MQCAVSAGAAGYTEADADSYISGTYVCYT